MDFVNERDRNPNLTQRHIETHGDVYCVVFIEETVEKTGIVRRQLPYVGLGA